LSAGVGAGNAGGRRIAATPAPRFDEFAPPWSSAAWAAGWSGLCAFQLANPIAKDLILAASVRDAPSQIAANAKSRLRSEHIDIAVAPQLKERQKYINKF
jgi:hypothetical protein